VDLIPSIADTGRSSPTGAVFYNHVKFPEQYRHALFLGDGRKVDPRGVSASQWRVLHGECRDVSVGPATERDGSGCGSDGWLYFITGGGGRVADSTASPGLAAHRRRTPTWARALRPAIRQPQLQSAWGRQQVAKVQPQLQGDWARCCWAWPAARRTHTLSHSGTGPDATLRSGSRRDAAAGTVSRQERDHSRQGGRTHGALRNDESGSVCSICSKTRIATWRRRALEPWRALSNRRRPTPSSRCWRRTTAARPGRPAACWNESGEQWRDAVLQTDQQRIFIQGAWPC